MELNVEPTACPHFPCPGKPYTIIDILNNLKYNKLFFDMQQFALNPANKEMYYLEPIEI